MAQKLLAYYDHAHQLGGLKAKLRLAVLTKMPSARAEMVDDSPENVRKFMTAISEIKKEFQS